MSDQQPEIYSITQNKDTVGLFSELVKQKY